MSSSKETEKQYGLISMKKANKSSQPLQKKLAIFDESDEEETPQSAINQKLQREAVKTKMRKQTKIEIQKALEEDPTVFEYDSIYDDMEHKKQERERMVKAKQRDSKPKYIAGLMKAANQRKMERERQKERKIQKEREKEGEEFGDKEQFVTASYKKKMQELAEDEERERREAERDGDVTKNMDMTGFYRHILEQTTGGVSEDSNKVEVKRETSPVTEPKTENDDDGDQMRHRRDRDESVEDKEDRRGSRDNHRRDNERHRDERHRRDNARDSDNKGHIERDYGKARDREKDRRHKENRGDKRDRRGDYDRDRDRGRSDKGFKSHDKSLDKDKSSPVSEGKQYGGSEKAKSEGKEWLRDKDQKIRSGLEKEDKGQRENRKEELKEDSKEDGKEDRKEGSRSRPEKGNEDADSDLDISEESEEEKEKEGDGVNLIEKADKQLEDKTKLKYAKRTTTDTVMSARDRYLARKMQRDAEKAHIAMEEDD